MAASCPQEIFIIGGGFSGTLTAVHLLREARPGQLRVTLIEQHRRAARGLAYRIWDDSMLLNVPAGNMSALADEPGHFLAYCRDIDPAFNEGSFVPRRLFGDYLEHTLQVAERASRTPFTRIRAQAVAVRRKQASPLLQIELDDGVTRQADQVVLALGHLGAQPLHFADALAGSSRYIGNPWDYAAMDQIPAGGPVVVLGTGHTAIDALFRLTSRDDERKVFLLSRRGLLPKGHRTLPQPPPTTTFPGYLEDLPPTTFAYLRAIRRQVRLRQRQGCNWRDVVNALRPHTPEIWRRLPEMERRRFLSRVGPWWDIHRHRLAPTAYRRLRGMLASGQAAVVAGQVLQMHEHGPGVRVIVRPRGGSEAREWDVAAVVNCTGPDYDIDRLTASPLVAQLRDEGYVRADPLHIGIDVDAGYHVVGADGLKVSGLHYVGPMLRARYWEAIAVPELRRHAHNLARHLLTPGQA
jgi:uncharacterized NAD(P)/FAD-binding protein YdhS